MSLCLNTRVCLKSSSQKRNVSISAILGPGNIGCDLPVAYNSSISNDHQKKYCTIEQELLTFDYSAKVFRCYLFGRPIKIIYDHMPLKWIMSVKHQNFNLVRRTLQLEEFDYQIIDKGGSKKTNANVSLQVYYTSVVTSGVTCLLELTKLLHSIWKSWEMNCIYLGQKLNYQTVQKRIWKDDFSLSTQLLDYYRWY